MPAAIAGVMRMLWLTATEVVPHFLEKAFASRVKPACAHPHAEILTFHNRSANAFGVWATHNWDLRHGGDFGGRVPGFALNGSLVNLDELREVRAILECVFEWRSDRGRIHRS